MATRVLRHGDRQGWGGTTLGVRATLVWLALVIVAGCERPQRVPQPEPFEVERDAWRFGRAEGEIIRTPNYKIHATIQDPQLLLVLPNFLETARLLYRELLPTETNGRGQSNLYLFNTRNEWDRFTRAFSPGRSDIYLRIRSGGYAEAKGTVIYRLPRRYYTMAVIAHECFHMYVFQHYDVRDVPPWLNEGLACYCEGHEWRGRRPVFTPGENLFRMNSVRRALAKGSLLELEELLGTNAGKMVRYTPQRVSTYYAQAWSLVTFLIHGETYSESFARLREELGTEQMRTRLNGYLAANPTWRGRPIGKGEALFRAYITDDLERFSAEHNVWLQKKAGLKDEPWDIFGRGGAADSSDTRLAACRLRPSASQPRPSAHLEDGSYRRTRLGTGPLSPKSSTLR